MNDPLRTVGPLLRIMFDPHPKRFRLPAAVRPHRTVTVTHPGPRVGRNDPCPCGAGVKFKKCHGKA